MKPLKPIAYLNPGAICSHHPRLLGFLGCSLAMLGLAGDSNAATFTWDGGGDSFWNTGDNWGGEPGTAPPATGSDLVFDGSLQTSNTNNLPVTGLVGIVYNSTASAFTSTGTQTVTLTGNITNNSAQTQTLNMPIAISGASRSVTVASGGTMVLGSTSAALVHSVNGSTAFKGTTPGVGTVEVLTSSTGSFRIGDATSSTTLDMSGLGTFTANVGEFRIAPITAVTNAQVTLAASNTISATKLTVGSVNGSAGNSTAYGTLKLGTANILNVDTIGVGLGSKAASNSSIAFNAPGSTVTISPLTDPLTSGRTNITLGNYTTSSGSPNFTGSMDFTGGTVTATKIGTLTMGYIGAGNITSTGTKNIRGAFTVDGSSSMVTADTVTLGKWNGNFANTTGNINASGTLTITDGSMTTASLLLAQKQLAAPAAAASVNYAFGTVNIAGGSLTVNNSFVMGDQTNLTGVSANRSVSVVSLTGGTLTSNVAITTGGTGGTTLYPTKTTLTLDGGILDMTGKAIGSAASPIGGGGGALNFQKGTLKNLAELNGGATFDKTTSGILTLEGTNTYSGLTTVSNGTLLVNGANEGFGTVSVAGLGTLGGTGSIAGAVTVDGGTLAPGASIESLSTGDLTLNTGSTFAYEMDSSESNPFYAADLQTVIGLAETPALNLNGTVYLTLSDLADSPDAFASPTTLSLIQYVGGWNGGFFTYVLNEVANELVDGEVFSDGVNTWTIDYNASAGGVNFASVIPGSQFITLSNTLTAIPEPGSWLALGGLLGCGAFLRRRRPGASF